MSLKPLLSKALTGLDAAETEAAFTAIMQGAASPVEIAALLVALRTRGETTAEITGAVRAMRAAMIPVAAPPGAMDCCGTGGDGHGTLNVSTAVAFVLAGCGVPVAKHGNRAASSRSGAADVLAALGVNLDAPQPEVERALLEAGTAFLLAPRYHPAMRHVAPVRAELGIRTIFNLLGPLANPAGVRRQLVGVFSPAWLLPMAEVLANLGAEAAWVVHGSDGLDELTVTGPTEVASWDGATISRFQVTPQQAGLPVWPLSALQGGDAAQNAASLRALLQGERGAYRDIVLLNAAAALVIAGRAATLADAAGLAASAIDSGQAAACASRLIAITNGAA